jgi:hypothetical protein
MSVACSSLCIAENAQEGVLCAHSQVPGRAQVYGLPTLVLFNGGDAVEGSKREGAIAKPGVLSWLESNGVTL